MFVKFAVFSIFALLLRDVHCNSAVRNTANGCVKGVLERTSMKQLYYAFRSVPYAEVPITGIDPYTQKFVDRRFKVGSFFRF